MHSDYGVALDRKSVWSFGNDFARNIIIFGLDNNWSSHTQNLKNDFSVLAKVPTFGITG